MKEKRVIPIWLSVVFLLLCLAVATVNFSWMVTAEHTPADIIAIALDILVVLVAVSYFAYGYKKEGAVFYRFYSTIFMCSRLFVLPVVMLTGAAPAFIIILRIFECAVAVVLAVGRDIGKNVSFAMVGAILFIELINAICVFANASLFTNQYFVITRAGGVVLAVIYGIMTIAKYSDKTARGTK